ALTPAAMARMTPQDCAEAFGFRMDRPHNRAMAEMYARALRQTGEHIEKNFDSDFKIFIEKSKPCVESFIQNMREIPRFDDTYLYPSRSGPDIEVPILKNAQHLAASLSVAYPRLGLPEPFEDTEKLTAFPDNKIAHVLWVDRVVRFSDDLSRRVENLIPIPVGSAEEIEIRVAGRHAVRMITAFTNAHRPDHPPVRQIDIDHRIWHASHGQSVMLTRKRYADTPCFRTQEMTCHY
ncbi:MAG TPA: queuosine salvage family protein, partial [Alphaproteobacteria bacterium]|nr:queuosine salvage family protein [Alphaproteobacteria bacterium]